LKLVVGLGNPGRRYAQTRHNAGFWVLDRWAEKSKTSWKRSWRFPVHLAKLTVLGCEVMLAKPRTYMNRSGNAVGPMVERLGISLGDMVVVVDDMDLPCGQLRIRPRGGSGGHNGLKSIIACLGTEGFTRVRVGIGPKPELGEVADFVLSDCTDEERERLEPALERAAEAVETILRDGVEAAMNRFN